MSYCEMTHKYYPANEMVIAYYIEENRKVIVNKNFSRLYKCIDCGEWFVITLPDFMSPYIDIKNNVVCHNCREKYYMCACCGEFILLEDKVMTDDGFVCKQCAENKYIKCDECGDYIHEDNIKPVGIYNYCEDCFNKEFTTCENCGEIIPRDGIYETADGYTLCQDCYYEECYECVECGRQFYRNIRWYEDNEKYYCTNCRGEGQIKSYNYKPSPKFKKCNNENANEYFGFEIEVDGDCSKSNQFLKEFGDTEENDIYLKHDGSVCGWEIVTQPMTRQYFYKVFIPKLTNGMRYLRNNGFKAHNYAGIHIHVSNDAIGLTQFNKMVNLFYTKNKKQYRTWLAITQRKHEKMQEWSSMDINDLKRSKTRLTKELNYRKLSKTNSKPELGFKRYMAINTQNEHTIEFRIFNSNLRIERIIKNAQVIFSLIDFCNSKERVSMNNYFKFIEKHWRDYKELYHFLLENNIYKPELSMEMLRDLSKEPNEEIQKYLSAIDADINLTVNDNDEEGDTICA